jgi:hypothetical protein
MYTPVQSVKQHPSLRSAHSPLKAPRLQFGIYAQHPPPPLASAYALRSALSCASLISSSRAAISFTSTSRQAASDCAKQLSEVSQVYMSSESE